MACIIIARFIIRFQCIQLDKICLMLRDNRFLMNEQKFKFTNQKWHYYAINGWGSKFGTTKCRTADISKIRNFEYWNNKSYSIFLFWNLFFYFYDCFNYSNTQNIYLIIYHQIRNFWNFDSFASFQILKIC